MTLDAGDTQPPARKTSMPLPAPILGVLFIVAGLAFLLGTFFPQATFDKLWPLLLLVPVAFLGQRYLEKREAAAGVLLPAGTLLYLAVFFLWLNFTSWSHSAVTWPHYLLAPAFGLFLLFLATRNPSHLVPVAVLCVLAFVFLAGLDRSKVAIAVVLIAVGIVLVVGSAFRRRKG